MIIIQPQVEPASEHSAGDIIARIGSLTRIPYDNLHELGLDQTIAETAEAISGVRDRLDYAVQMITQAAERVLDGAEASQPYQDAIGKEAKDLTKRWDE